MRDFRIRLRLAALLIWVAACGSNLHVTTIQVGRSLNADQTVAGHTTTFKPNETVYVSVILAGAGSGTLSVKWTYRDSLVGEPKKEVSGAGATEFHLQNAGGFPVGDYKVEAFLNGQPAGSRTFRVDAR